MTITKDLKKWNTTISDCWIERGFGGYLIDVFTAGAYTTYRTKQYTKCLQDILKKDVPNTEKLSTANIDNGEVN